MLVLHRLIAVVCGGNVHRDTGNIADVAQLSVDRLQVLCVISHSRLVGSVAVESGNKEPVILDDGLRHVHFECCVVDKQVLNHVWLNHWACHPCEEASASSTAHGLLRSAAHIQRVVRPVDDPSPAATPGSQLMLVGVACMFHTRAQHTVSLALTPALQRLHVCSTFGSVAAGLLQSCCFLACIMGII